MPPKEDKLDDEQVKEVFTKLIIRITSYINVNKAFYRDLQYYASELGYIKELEYSRNNEWVLSNNLNS